MIERGRTSFTAYVTDLPDCVATGSTEAEVREPPSRYTSTACRRSSYVRATSGRANSSVVVCVFGSAEILGTSPLLQHRAPYGRVERVEHDLGGRRTDANANRSTPGRRSRTQIRTRRDIVCERYHVFRKPPDGTVESERAGRLEPRRLRR